MFRDIKGKNRINSIVNEEKSEREELERRLTRIIEEISDYCDDNLSLNKSPTLIVRSNSRASQSLKKSPFIDSHPQLSPLKNTSKRLNFNGAIRPIK